MPRFTNSLTGVVVNVDEETASQLGPDWVKEGGGSKSADSDAKTTTRRRKSN